MYICVYILSISSITIYVIVIPWAQVLCLMYTQKHEGVSPSASAYISGKA